MVPPVHITDGVHARFLPACIARGKLLPFGLLDDVVHGEEADEETEDERREGHKTESSRTAKIKYMTATLLNAKNIPVRAGAQNQ